jgi:hypothetical protein
MQTSILNFDRLSRASAFNTCGLDLPHVAVMHDRYGVTSWSSKPAIGEVYIQ